MNFRILSVPFLLLGLAGITPPLQAAGTPVREGVTLPYDILDPSVRVAKRYQKHGDYVTAVLLYDAILERNPSDAQALKSMVECYQALEKNERKGTPESIHPEKATGEDALSDLPNLIPDDHANAQRQTPAPGQSLL